MTTLRRCALVLSVMATLGCQTSAPAPQARADDEGAVYLYLQPLPREAERLRATLQSVSALGSGGRELPLALSLRELKSPDGQRQRLLAAGPLPAGEYAGFAVRAGPASLRREDGEAALLAGDEPARIDFRFTVRRREASVIALVLRYAESVDGARFHPTFSVYTPERPAAALTGFVSNTRSSDVTLFDKKAGQVFDVIATGRGPTGMALDQRARRLYVSLSGEDAVEVIDVAVGRTTERVRLTVGDEPVALALTPDGRTLLSANRGSNTVSVIDADSRLELERVRVGAGPRAILVDRTGRRAFVFNGLGNTVSVIDVPSRVVLRTIVTDPGPVQGHFSRTGDRLWVVHEATSYVTAIASVSLSVLRRFPVRSAMDAIKVDPGTDLVYLGGRREPVLGLYEPFQFTPVDSVDTGAGVVHIALDSEENTLYLVTPVLRRVLTFDRIRKRSGGGFDVGDGPAWVSVMGEH